jgi:hypothetical protein
MHIEVLSFEPTSSMMLMPTPNVTDSEYITQCLQVDKRPEITDLATSGHIEILADYRGRILYCSGGISVYRYDPKTSGGNGCINIPFSEIEEDVHVISSVGTFNARVKFVPS